MTLSEIKKEAPKEATHYFFTGGAPLYFKLTGATWMVHVHILGWHKSEIGFFDGLDRLNKLF